MTHRTLFALVLTILSVTPPSSDAGSRVRDIVFSELQDRVLQSGSARVIVKVRLPGGPHVPEGRLAGAAVSLQQADIASVQAQIMGRLAATPHRLLHRYTTVPLLAFEVGLAALAELAASSLQVERVVEDGLSAPTAAQTVPLIQTQQAWANGFDGTGWMVAILDTGVDTTHPFLAAKVTEAACYSSTVRNTSTTLCPNGQEEQTGPAAGVSCPIDTCWHGTHVTGIASGYGVGAGVSFSGVARGAEIMAIQVFPRFDNSAKCGGSAPCVLSWDSDLIAGLERVHVLRDVHTFAAANVNLGGGLSTSSCDATSRSS